MFGIDSVLILRELNRTGFPGGCRSTIEVVPHVQNVEGFAKVIPGA